MPDPCLAAWPSRDLITAAQQQITQEWWRWRRSRFDLFTSQLGLIEAAAGDSSASARRMAILKGLQLLEMSDEARDFASRLMETTPLPRRAGPDALHITLATLNGMDYLLTRIRKEEEAAGPSLVRRSPRPAGEMPEQAA